ncbi:MAG: nitrate/sulfonate/bicarbonate ABC transporter substrate-binding protein [Candidatus Desulfovibrio kirbyi]|jgi:NitT/TauT family transport system substrate-binding protein|uniref:Nitrate/sulfonate/bicarbonate ABC transporter substrate-binding protein n=1 Tax=Candidatus Desulfovibrio kirbyi TaxID=2696086 RepID=A0A6L2R6M5_9BACT|nr:MAG: nitrate/sulfonate/bicarbonate ABC transporter substrate-binding protein [Candidatus Desulfovibrio kirbyi]
MSFKLDVSRREFLRLSALLTGATVLPKAGFAAEKAGEQTVRIGYLPITDSSPLLVAHANKLFEAEGLQVDRPRMFRSWSQVAEAFMAGQVNVVHLLSPITVWARFGSKFPARITAWNHMAGSGLTAAPEVNSVADFGGKKVAIPFWYSIHNVVLQKILRKANLKIVTVPKDALDKNEVSLVVMAPADMGPALAQKTIAGFIVAEPFNAAAEFKNIGKILRFTSDVWNNHACCVIFQHQRDLDERPEWSQKVVNAIVKAQLWMRTHRVESAAILADDGAGKYTPFPKPVLERVLVPNADLEAQYFASGANIHKNWNHERIDFQPYPFPSYTQALIESLRETVVEGDNAFLKTLDPTFATKDLVDERFVRSAIESVGGLKAFGINDGWDRKELIEA